MKTWKPQKLHGSLERIIWHINNNPGIKTVKVSPVVYAQLLSEMHNLQRVRFTSIDPQGFTVVKIMGVTIELL